MSDRCDSLMKVCNTKWEWRTSGGGGGGGGGGEGLLTFIVLTFTVNMGGCVTSVPSASCFFLSSSRRSYVTCLQTAHRGRP